MRGAISHRFPPITKARQAKGRPTRCCNASCEVRPIWRITRILAVHPRVRTKFTSCKFRGCHTCCPIASRTGALKSCASFTNRKIGPRLGEESECLSHCAVEHSTLDTRHLDSMSIYPTESSLGKANTEPMCNTQKRLKKAQVVFRETNRGKNRWLQSATMGTFGPIKMSIGIWAAKVPRDI